MKEEILKEIERINVLILTSGSIAILLFLNNFKYFLSFALGSAIVSLNFRILKGIILKGFSDSKMEKKGLFLKLALKFIGLMAAIFFVIVYGDVQILYFIIGTSTVFLSIIFAQFPIFKFLSDGGKGRNGA